MIHSFFITPDGSSTSVYTDKLIDVYEQLEHECHRASNVEYDNDLQLWVAEDAETGHIISMQTVRQDAIDDEIEYLNEKFRNSGSLLLEVA